MSSEGIPMSIPIPVISFDTTLGAVFIGYSFAIALYGATCLQAITYCHRCKKDSGVLKCIIITLCLLDTLNTILVSHGAYLTLVSSRLAPLATLEKLPWSYCVQVFITVISNLLVRTVFASRIYRLSHGNIIIPVIVILLSFYVLATGIIFGTEALKAASWAKFRNFSWVMYSGYGAEMTADAVIASCMSLLLVRMRTGLQSSDTLLQTLVIYSINTGLLTTICVFLSLITFITLPNSLAFLACYFILSKLYVNSLLGTLNARSKMHLQNSSSRNKVISPGDPDTNPSGYTPPPATGILTTAITLGTMDADIESGWAHDELHRYDRYEMKHTPATHADVDMETQKDVEADDVGPHLTFKDISPG